MIKPMKHFLITLAISSLFLNTATAGYIDTVVKVEDKELDMSLDERGNLKLSLDNPDKSTISVFIIDAFGQVRYQDSINGQLEVEKEYNLRKLPAGRYTIVINDGNKVYTKGVKLR